VPRLHCLLAQQAKNDVLAGKYPLSKEETKDLAALQVQIEYGDHNPNIHKTGFLKLEVFIPPQWRKDKKEIEKNILAEHKKFVGMAEINAKFRYVQLIRSLKTFGITFFQCKEKGELRNKKNKGKLVPILIGITREKIIRMDPDTREVIEEVPLTHLKRWAAKQGTFTFDWGDYSTDYYQVQTTEGDAMSQLIAGYIDIILKTRREAVRAAEEDGAETASAETLAHTTGAYFHTIILTHTSNILTIFARICNKHNHSGIYTASDDGARSSDGHGRSWRRRHEYGWRSAPHATGCSTRASSLSEGERRGYHLCSACCYVAQRGVGKRRDWTCSRGI
jgi:hypothetical protein